MNMSEKKKKSRFSSFIVAMNNSDLDRHICEVISKRNLTLAGFTLTALSLMIGFFKDDLSEATVILQGLFFSMLMFFLGSQIGHEAERLWHILLSDLLQYTGTLVLIGCFSLFVYERLGSFYLFFVAGMVVIVIYLIKAVSNILVLVKSQKRNG
jgi:hypothetical protein